MFAFAVAGQSNSTRHPPGICQRTLRSGRAGLYSAVLVSATRPLVDEQKCGRPSALLHAPSFCLY
jgi:hypothetical protein